MANFSLGDRPGNPGLWPASQWWSVILSALLMSMTLFWTGTSFAGARPDSGLNVLNETATQRLAETLQVNQQISVAGFIPDSLQVEKDRVNFGLIGDDGRKIHMLLVHPTEACEDCFKSPDFNVIWLGPGERVEQVCEWTAARLAAMEDSPWIETVGAVVHGPLSRYFWFELWDSAALKGHSLGIWITGMIHRCRGVAINYLARLLQGLTALVGEPILMLLLSMFLFLLLSGPLVGAEAGARNLLVFLILVGSPICLHFLVFFSMVGRLQASPVMVLEWQVQLAVVFAWLTGLGVKLPGMLFGSGEKRWRLILGVLFLLALGLRLALPPKAPFHENQVFYSILSVGAGFENTPEFFGKSMLYLVMLKLLDLSGHGVFLFNILVSSLAAPVAALLGRDLFSDRRAGWFAGLIISLSPVCIRLGASESYFSLASTLSLLALWSGIRGLREDNEGLVLLSALTMAMVVNVRVLTVLYSLVYLTILLPDIWKRRRTVAAWIVFSPLLASLAHGVVIITALDESSSGMTGIPQGMAMFHGLQIEPDLVPPLFAGLGLVGFLVLFYQSRWVGLTLAAGIMLSQLIGSLISVHFSNHLVAYCRHMLLSVHLWALPAGLASHYLLTRFARGHILPAALALHLVSASLVNIDFMIHEFPQNRQFKHVSAMAPHLRGDWSFHWYDVDGLGQIFGSRWFVDQLAPAIKDEGEGQGEGQGTESGRKQRLLYIGLVCSSIDSSEKFSDSEAVIVNTRYGPLRRECAEALAAGDWKELHRTYISGESYLGYPVRPFRAAVPLVWLWE